MFDLTFLGTSASVPSAERNHPGLLIEAAGHRILVDCGEGTQRQLLRSGAGFRRVDRLLLTHGHFDHVLGIPGLFSTLRLRQSADHMRINAGPGTLGGGKKMGVVVDTDTIDGLADYVGGADLLVIEATFLERDAAMALDYGHLTAAKAARLASEAGVKRLVLTHISGRYGDDNIL